MPRGLCLMNYNDDQNDDLKKKKKKPVHDQNNSSARTSHFLVHFFDVHWTTTTDVKPPNLTFYGGRGHMTKNFPSSF